MLTDLDEIYGDSGENEEPKSEKSLPNPTNPYAASKAACEFIVRSYFVSTHVAQRQGFTNVFSTPTSCPT